MAARTLYMWAETGVEDKLFWRFFKDGCFSARSFYEVLRGAGHLNFPRKAIWRVKVPNKVFNVVCDFVGSSHYRQLGEEEYGFGKLGVV